MDGVCKEGWRKDLDIPNKHVKMIDWGIRLRLREEMNWDGEESYYYHFAMSPFFSFVFYSNSDGMSLALYSFLNNGFCP